MPLSKQRKNFGWCVSHYFDLIKYPIFTEKSDNLCTQGQYTFAVASSLTKIEIKFVIQELFNVKVRSVNTATQILKNPRSRKRFTNSRTKLKKAFVTLAPGNEIKLLKTFLEF